MPCKCECNCQTTQLSVDSSLPEVESFYDSYRDLVKVKIRRWPLNPDGTPGQKWGLMITVPLERMFQIAEGQHYPEVRVLTRKEEEKRLELATDPAAPMKVSGR